MKKGNNRAIWVAVGIVVLAGLLYLLFFAEQKFDWRETYRNDSKEPYGTYILHQTLQGYFPDNSFTTIEGRLSEADYLDTINCCATYIYVGDVQHLDSLGIDRLLRFMERGNTAFLSVNAFPFFSMGLNEVLCVSQDGFPYENDTVAELKLGNETVYRYQLLYEHEPLRYPWRYIAADECFSGTYLPFLGSLNGIRPNYLSIAMGKGRLLLHTTPLAFTNYYMADSSHLPYPNKVLSYLSPGDVYWDEGAREYIRGESSQYQTPDTPLRFILSQPSLRWAWYLMIAAILLYVLFYMKRRQKAIPIIHPYENTSLEFVQTIGSLYLAQNNHKKLALQRMKLFLAFIRNRYHVNTQQDEEELIRHITRKSQVDEKHVKRIFSKKKSIDLRNDIDVDTLIEFHKLIEHFYKTAK